MSLFGVLKQADPALVTISTIGYGQMSPATLYGNIVMTVEAMFGPVTNIGFEPQSISADRHRTVYRAGAGLEYLY